MILLIVVAFVVAHPLVDLEPTVLRHLQVSVLLLVAVAFTRSVTADLVGACSQYNVIDKPTSLRKDSRSRIDLTSLLLC
jgi:hypothetical protein